MKRILEKACAACALPLICALPIAHAQCDVVTKVNPEPDPNKGQASSYWTPERFKAAKPLPMPVVKPGEDPESKAAPGAETGKRPASSHYQAPSAEPAPVARQLHDSGQDPEKLQRDAIPQPRDK